MKNYKRIFIIYFFLAFLIFPLIVFSQVGCRQIEVPIPGLKTTCLPALSEYIVAIFKFVIMISGIIAFGALLYGGFRFLTSAGSAAAMSDARDQIFSAFLGLIILLSSYLILTTINPELVILGEPVKKCTKKEDCPGDQVCMGGVCSPPFGGETFEIDCTNYNLLDCPSSCKRCPACSEYNSVNKWEVDKCVFPEVDCGYHCKIGVCGAECEDETQCEPPPGFYATCVNCKCEYLPIGP